MFEQPNKPRKLKVVGSADEGIKELEHSAEAAVKAFKAYIYSLRNEVADLAPDGWKLADVEDGEVFEAGRQMWPCFLIGSAINGCFGYGLIAGSKTIKLSRNSPVFLSLIPLPMAVGTTDINRSLI